MPRGVYPRTAAHNAAISAAKKGHAPNRSPEGVERWRQVMAGRVPWNKGIKLDHPAIEMTPEVRAKISAASTGRRHTAESREKLRLAGLGRVHSPERRAKTAAASKRLWREHPEWYDTLVPLPFRRGRVSNLEKILYQFLEYSGFCFEKQKRIGSKFVDAYLPIFGLAFEADGDYWHQKPEVESERDRYLAERGVVVIHLTEQQLKAIALGLGYGLQS